MDALESDEGLTYLVSTPKSVGPLLGRAEVGGWGWRMGNRTRFKSPTAAHCKVFVGLKKNPTNVFPRERAGIWMPDTQRRTCVLASIRPRSNSSQGKGEASLHPLA